MRGRGAVTGASLRRRSTVRSKDEPDSRGSSIVELHASSAHDRSFVIRSPSGAFLAERICRWRSPGEVGQSGRPTGLRTRPVLRNPVFDLSCVHLAHPSVWIGKMCDVYTSESGKSKYWLGRFTEAESAASGRLSFVSVSGWVWYSTLAESRHVVACQYSLSTRHTVASGRR